MFLVYFEKVVVSEARFCISVLYNVVAAVAAVAVVALEIVVVVVVVFVVACGVAETAEEWKVGRRRGRQNRRRLEGRSCTVPDTQSGTTFDTCHTAPTPHPPPPTGL